MNASAVESPVALVHTTCNEMLKANPQLTRKDVMAALLAKGVNRHTISTQWQRWNAARKAQKARLDRKLYALPLPCRVRLPLVQALPRRHHPLREVRHDFLATVHVACIWMWLCN